MTDTLLPGAMTGEDLIAWFDGEAPKLVSAAAAELPFFGPVFAPAPETSPVPPDEAPYWLPDVDYRTNEEFEQAVVNVTETGRKASWLQADLFAAAWMRTPYGQRGKLMNRLGHLIGKHARTAQRMASIGATFPPDLRDYARPMNIYEAALKAADPCAVIESALLFGWDAKEIKQHIDTGQAPTHREKLLAEDWPADCDPEDVAALVHSAIRAAQRDGHPEYGRLLELRVNVSAVYAASEAEREAA